MDDDDRQLKLAVICALVGVAGMALQVGLSHPVARMWLSGLVHKARTWYRADPYEGQVRQFANQVSRWDHEQASQQDRRPAAGGCGCGG